ncbi:hypothetical protein [Halopseudomonas sp.]|uniref:hypothetical protein n=1 Tax=Halopseudomonas sp. TaxID=2901191 RepID=UPI003002044E
MSQTRKDFEAEGKEYRAHPCEAVIRRMVEDPDRPGKRAGRGFYDYPEGDKKRQWSGLAEHWPVKAERGENFPARQDCRGFISSASGPELLPGNASTRQPNIVASDDARQYRAG